MISMKLKIKRHEYEITRKDLFMDNGACVQLISQSKERSYWGHRPSPRLSKKAIAEINKYPRIERPHKYGRGVIVFSLGLNDD